MSLAGFDEFCDKHGITDEELPHAFAAWLARTTSWDGTYEEVPHGA